MLGNLDIDSQWDNPGPPVNAFTFTGSKISFIDLGP